MSDFHQRNSSYLETVWIYIYSWLSTIYYSLCAYFVAFSVKNKAQRRAKSNAIIQAWSAGLLRVIRLDYKIHNPFQFEAGKQYIVMCNHTSLYDIPLSFKAVEGTMRMVAKKELARTPFMGRAMKATEFIFLDRKNREQAVKDLAAVQQKMQDGLIIWICPKELALKQAIYYP